MSRKIKYSIICAIVLALGFALFTQIIIAKPKQEAETSSSQSLQGQISGINNKYITVIYSQDAEGKRITVEKIKEHIRLQGEDPEKPIFKAEYEGYQPPEKSGMEWLKGSPIALLWEQLFGK